MTQATRAGRTAAPLWPYPLFVVSGFAALVLETVLLRQLAWLFGNSARATALVLAAFMGGLALGAVAFGRRADATRRPLRLFGRLEIGTAISGAGLVWLLGSGREWFLAPLRLVDTPAVERTAEFVLAFALVLVPTILMGGTLPALGRAVIRDPRRFARSLGLLYGMNTLGAATGVFAAGFFLFERFGVSRAAYLSAAVQALVGLTAIFLGRNVTAQPAASPGRPADRPLGESAEVDSRATARARACVLAAMGGGFAVLGYEVIWTRVLSLFMRSFSYSFSLMLALFLTGLFIGALLVPWVDRFAFDRLRVLGGLLVAMGVWVATSVYWLPALLSPIGASSFEAFLVSATVRAMPVVLPPTLLSGIALPLAVAGYARGVGRVGRDVGAVFAANTVGAISGALAAGLVLLPAFGAPTALVVLAALNAAVGVVVLRVARVGFVPVTIAAGLTLACMVPAFGANVRYVKGFLQATRNVATMGEMLFFHEGAADTVAIVRRTYGFRDPEAKSLITNGVAMSASVKPVWRYMALEGHLPVLLAQEPDRVLAVGVGTGITLGAVVSHPEVRSIQAVELSEGVLRGLDRFGDENGFSYRDPRVTLIREDGRHFLELSRESFDVITLEPPPPIVAGAGHLYSYEFYDLCLDHLDDGGVVAQWLPLHAQSLASAKMVARTFLDAFPHAMLWLPSIRDAVLVGSRTPLTLDLARVRRAWSTPETRANLTAAYLETPEALLATSLLDRAGIERWVGRVPRITDERPRMEFFRHQGGNMSDTDIAPLLEISQAGWDWLEGAPPGYEARLALENRALRLYLHSVVEQDAVARVSAARVSLATEFFLYPLGCTAEQLEALGRDERAAPGSVAAHRADCEKLRAVRSVTEGE